jgi:hypothetical protein
MAVSFMRWQRCLASERFVLSRAAIAAGAGKPATPTNHRRNNALRARKRVRALIYGGAID